MISYLSETQKFNIQFLNKPTKYSFFRNNPKYGQCVFIKVCVYTIEYGNLLMVKSIFRPNDSRMIMALGECYEKLDRLQEAKKCFWKAHRIGDIEETSLFKLAKYDLFLTLNP